MKNVVVLNATGSVLRYGFTDFTTDSSFNPATMSQVQVLDDAVPPRVNNVEVELKYVKVVSAQFVEMTAPEKAAVDAATAVAIVQRIFSANEFVVSSGAGGADLTTGFATALGGVKTSRPLKAGDYQLSLTAELALVAGATWGATGPDRAAEARLLWNGAEVQRWLWEHASYSTISAVLGATMTEGSIPTIDFQIRRYGTAGSARVRRVRIELAPTMSAITL